MIFCSTSGSAAGMAATGEAASFAGAAIGSVFGGTTGAIGGASGSGGARMREMGGRNEVLRAPSPSARLHFVHGKDVDEVLDRGVAQSFQVREAGFHERERLFLRDRQPTG